MISISTTARPNLFAAKKRFGVAEKLRFGSKFTAAFGRPTSGNSFSLEVHPKLDINTLLCGVWQLMGCTSLVAGVKAPLAMGKTAKFNCFESQLASVVLQTQQRFRWPNEWCPFLWSPGRKFLWHPFTPKTVELTLALKLSIWKLLRPIHGMMAWSCFTSPTSRCSSTHSNRIPSGK